MEQRLGHGQEFKKGGNMNKSNFKQWIKAAGIRAIKTVAQTAIATIGTTALFTEVNWAVVASASVLAGILSILTSIAGLPEVDKPEEDDNDTIQ